MNKEFTRGYYSMKNNMLPILVLIQKEGNILNESICFNECDSIIRTRIDERGDLGGESFTNLCKLEAEFIIKLFQSSYETNKNLEKIKLRMSELKYLIDNLQILVKTEFNAKSLIMETALKQQRLQEDRNNIKNDFNNEKLRREFRTVFAVVILGFLAIPLLLKFMGVF